MGPVRDELVVSISGGRVQRKSTEPKKFLWKRAKKKGGEVSHVSVRRNEILERGFEELTEYGNQGDFEGEKSDPGSY